MNQADDDFNYHFNRIVESYKNLEKRNQEHEVLLDKIGECTNIEQVEDILDERYKL